MLDVTKQLFTLGWFCQRFQVSIGQVQAILHAADIEPVLSINELEHYDGAAVIAVSRALRAAADAEVSGDE